MSLKKITVVLLSVLLALSCFAGCEKNNYIKVIDEESFLNGYSVSDNVEFNCSITVKNTSDKDVEFTLSAQADESDVNSGLL
ncbi:MAG: hypothetical protein IKQ18_03575, partial [Clostridia bacterium]|nr:hypothetical protein [Clostridia bacterium]